MNELGGKTEEEYNVEWYNEYKNLGGKSSSKVFLKHLKVFIDLTLDSYTNGDTTVTREEAYTNWAKYIKSWK